MADGQSLKAARSQLIAELQQVESFLPVVDQSHSNETGSGNSIPATGRSSTLTQRSKREDILNRLSFEFSELKFEYRTLSIDLDRWKKRFKMLSDVLPDLRPTNDLERQGLFETQEFPLFPLLKDVRTMREKLGLDSSLALWQGMQTIAEDDESSNFSRSTQKGSDELHWLNLKKYMDNDDDLAVALESIKGQENNIVVACCKAEIRHKDDCAMVTSAASHAHEAAEEPRDQNMTAWAALKVRNTSVCSIGLLVGGWVGWLVSCFVGC
jgi:hypothetical protein